MHQVAQYWSHFTKLLDSALSGGSRYPMFEQPGPKRDVNTPAQIALENEIKVILMVKLCKNACLSC